jgi:uncharacterized protein (TIGR00255 family)
MRSMTGFGRASGEVSGRRCVVEVRSVNHRFLDLKLRLSPGWSDPLIEQLVTQAVRRRVERGSLVVTLRDEGVAQTEAVVRVDHDLARAYGHALRQLAQALQLGRLAAPESEPLPQDTAAPILALVASQPGVLLQGESVGDPEARFQLLEPVVEQALAALIESRRREGEALGVDLGKRLQLLSQLLAEVGRLVEGAPEVHRRRLEERLSRLIDGGTPIDPQRLAQEVALLADRLDVTEEITRLRTHFGEFARLCQGESVAGRRLDFLTQEMNREVNTISAKAQSAEVAARIVAMKAELERLREQIQNVE